jgi:DNA-binding transcriptional LysR family regulator
MELYTMRYVLAVAEYENFSLAAQACHVGQPALSQQIAKLEKQLGVALFHRNSRGASLTQAGEAFVNRAREILAELESEGGKPAPVIEKEPEDQVSLLDLTGQQVIAALSSITVETLTPIEAMNELYKLKKMLN